MKKYISIAVISLVAMISGILVYRQNQDTPSNYFKELEKELVSYEIGGILELVDDEALRQVQIQSFYQKQDEQDYFYVRLEDLDTKQVQTIIKNADGVFVVSQGFNRAFQFKTEWPYNGFKPYILQTIFQAIKEEYEENKIRDGFIINTTINDPTHPNVVSTQILFDQNLAMRQVNLLDENDNEIIQFEITQYIINPEVDPNLFVVNTEEDVEVSIQEDLPMYPLESYQAELIDQLTTNEGYILRYQGEKYFTLIQKLVEIKDELSIEVVDGDFYLYEDGLLFYSNEEISLIKDGLKTTIYSNDLTSEEQMDVLLSLQNSIVIQP